MDLISVIIPIYNSSEYLTECLNSIINQTYKNLEIILIDDASTDDSIMIEKQFCQNDSRIIVEFLSERQGQGACRNLAIDKAKGKYLSFVDSDDTIAPNFIETLYYNAIHNNAQMSVCYMTTIQNNFSLNSSSSQILNSREATIHFLKNPLFGAFSWNKLFDATLFRSVGKYPINMIYEDVAFIPTIPLYANRIVLCESPLYFNRQHSQSTVGQKFSPKRMDSIKACDILIPILLAHFPDLESEIYEKAFLFIMGILNTLILDCYFSPEYETLLLSKAKSYRKKIHIKNIFDKKKFIIFSLAFLYYPLYKVLLKLFYHR